MKKLIIFYFLILMNTNSYADRAWKANDWRTKPGEVIRGEFKSSNKMRLPLPEGEWLLIEKYGETVGWGIAVEELTFVNMKNNVPTKFLEIGRATGLSKWQAYLTSFIESAVFQSKTDGCRKRQHYNYLNFYKRGNAHNCMIVEFLDVNKLLYPSEYDPDSIFRGGIRRWIEREKIDIPKNYLSYTASFFSMAVRDEWFAISYGVTPEEFANYIPKNSQRDQSDFHPNNIKNFPKALKIMENWLIESANFHKEWEKFQKARKSQKLDLSPYVASKTKTNKKKNDFLNNNNISEELIKLNELYKSGVLTESEFKKAKQKLLK